MASHGITASAPNHPTTGRGPAFTDYMAHFDGHFYSLSTSATNIGADLDQLAANTTTQYAETKALLAALKTASSPSSYAAAAATDSTPSIPPTEDKHRTSQLEAAICKN